MQQAVGLQLEQTFFRHNFSINRRLPENLIALDAISQNFYWSWTNEGTNLFRDLDPILWEKYEQNPRRVLREISELRLWQKANEPAYVERVNHFNTQVENYLAQSV
ncbi:MAG: DUF3417 domain-containing protein [Blastocatellia bacterium]|nr:DUF3417 domain-containing protein [Blastocatellia bacterium]